ncbi:MAG: Mu transposase domain-containing protein, partial [Candidatus Saccharimonadales bacterium]
VEYIRRKVFAFKDHFKTFQEAQQYLEDRVLQLNKRPSKGAQMSPYDRLQEEKPHLLAYQGKMECFDGDRSKVDKFATICVGTNRYSVPDRLTGRTVFVKIYSSVLEISYEQKVVCTHPRSYERGGWYINLDHYLLTLSRKPGAVSGSLALKQAPQWIQQLYKQHFAGSPRGFVELLQYCKAKDVTHARLKATVEKLMHHHSGPLEVDHIIALLGNQPESPAIPVQMHGPNAIVTQAMENLCELASMMG